MWFLDYQNNLVLRPASSGLVYYVTYLLQWDTVGADKISLYSIGPLEASKL
jgi:hypothetical protein